jgi:hypothetical protein
VTRRENNDGSGIEGSTSEEAGLPKLVIAGPLRELCSENQGFWDAPRTDESSAFASGAGVLPLTAAIDVNDLLDQGPTRNSRLDP